MENRHANRVLRAFLSGGLPPAEAEEVRAHLASCADCRSEHDLLAEAASVLPLRPLPEPRLGLAVQIAAAAEASRRPRWAGQLRWALGGGLATAGLTAALLFGMRPNAPRPGPGSAPPNPLLAQRLEVAENLDLYEDLSVVQNQQALEDLEIVSQLHRLQPEAAQ